MAYPRYNTSRGRRIRMQGTFSLPVAYFFNQLRVHTVGAVSTVSIRDGGWHVFGHVKARCGPWFADVNLGGGQTQDDGLTWGITPFQFLQLHSGSGATADLYAGLTAQFQGMTNTVIQVVAPASFPGYTYSVVTGDDIYTYATPQVLSGSIDGTYDIDLNLLEYVDNRQDSSFSPVQFPFTTLEYFDAGTPSTCTIVVNGTTISVPITSTVTHFDPYYMGVAGDLFTVGYSGISVNGGAVAATVTESYSCTGLSGDAQTFTASNAAGSLSESNVSLNAPSPGTNFSATNTGSFKSNWRNAWTDNVVLVAKNFDLPNVESFDVQVISNNVVVDTVTGVTSGFTRSYANTKLYRFVGQLRAQHQVTSVSSQTDDVNTSYTQNSTNVANPIAAGGVKLRMTSASTTALIMSGGFTNYPIPVYMFSWFPVSVTVPLSVVLEQSPFSIGGGGWTGTNCTVSEVSGKLRFTVGGSAGKAQYNTTRFIGYRYLTIRIRTVGSANQGFAFGVGGETLVSDTYGLTTGADGTFVDVIVDLAYKPARTIFNTITFLNQSKTETADGTLYGNNLLLVFANLVAGKVYEIESITAFRTTALVTDSALLHTASNLNLFPIGTVDGAYTSHDGNNPVVGTTIGHWAHNLQGDAGSGTPTVWTSVATKPWMAWATSVLTPRTVGKTATNRADSTPVVVPLADLMDEDASYSYLMGGGIMGDGTVLTERPVKDSPAYNVPAQVFTRDAITLYAGAGDVFQQSGGGYGDTTLNFAIDLRGSVMGIIVPTGNPSPSTGLPTLPTVREYLPSPLTEEGTGTPEPTGYFHTSNIYAHVTSSPNHTVEVQSGTPYPANTAVGASHGFRNYLTFLYTPDVTRWLSAAISLTGRMIRATTNTAGKLIVATASNFAANTWADIVSTISAGRPCLRIDGLGKVWVSYEDGSGGIVVRSTDTEGSTFNVATVVTSSGTFSTFCITPTGAQHHFWRGASGTVLGNIIDSHGIIQKTGITAVSSGAADDALTAWFHKDTGKVFLEYRRASDSAIITVSSVDGGVTFT